MKVFAIIFLITASCQTTAPSNHELNRRSGLSVGADLGEQSYKSDHKQKTKQISGYRSKKATSKAPKLAAPVVEKVWVRSQQISENTWLEGTWLYIQVEKAKWVKNRGKK